MNQSLFPDEATDSTSGPDSGTSFRRGFVIGVDPSLTNTGVVVLDHKATVVLQRGITSKPLGSDVKSRMERVRQITMTLLEILNKYRPDVVTIETYAMHSKGQLAFMAELGCMLRYVIVDGGVTLYEVAPSTLKKWVTGSGKSIKNADGTTDSKTATIVTLTRRYDLNFASNDIYDAYALARMAFQIAGHEKPEFVYQMEAIATITEPKVKKTKSRRKKTDEY